MWADIKIALSHQQGWTTTSARRSIACPMPHNRLATLSVFDSIILAPLWQICDHSCDCIAGCRWGSNKLETSPAEQRWSADRALPWHVWDGRLEACVDVSVRQCRKHCIAMSITRSSRDLLNTAHILTSSVNMQMTHAFNQPNCIYMCYLYICKQYDTYSLTNSLKMLSSINNINMSTFSFFLIWGDTCCLRMPHWGLPHRLAQCTTPGKGLV